MEAGKELDTLIAEKIMELREFCSYAGKHKATLGWGKNGADFFRGEIFALPKFSSDLSSAFNIVEKIGKRFVLIAEDRNSNERCYKAYFMKNGEEGYPVSYSDSPAHVICLAALKVLQDNVLNELSMLNQEEELD